ncbi:MAG: diaminopimelate epimerase [Saprospiraceae bacterium]
MSHDHTQVAFVKYHGAGNDFICIDDRDLSFAPFETQEQIGKLCRRHLGVGADGLILLRNDAEHQLRMVYYNADGAPSSFCGNGSRCFIHFVHRVGLLEIGAELTFVANDGVHVGKLQTAERVEVSMIVSADLKQLSDVEDFVDTGSPHFIRWMEVLPKGEINTAARVVRYGPAFAKTGVNVNFVAVQQDDSLAIRTYERGVEDETLACGTGITAAAISFAERRKKTGRVEVPVRALGGDLTVTFDRLATGALSNVILIGPAQPVFSATVELVSPARSAS